MLSSGTPVIKARDKKTEIDSLENLLYNAVEHHLSDQKKLDICNTLSGYYAAGPYEKSLEYGIRGLKIAEETGNINNTIIPISNIANAYFNLCDYAQAETYLNRLFGIYKDARNLKEMAEVHLRLGQVYYHWSKYDISLHQVEKAHKIFTDLNDERGIANSLNRMAGIVCNWGYYDKGVEYYQQSLGIYEKNKDEAGLASTYNGLGILYQEWNKLEKAYDYYNEALKLSKKNNKTLDIINITLHIGDIYLLKKDYKKALEYYFNAEKLVKEINHKKFISITLSNIGEAYNLTGEYKKALEYQHKALAIKLQVGDDRRTAITLTELGLIYMNLKQTDSAAYYLMKGLEMSLKIRFKLQIVKCYKGLAELFELKNDFRQAYLYQKQYITAKDSLFSEERDQKITELQIQYEFDMKEKEKQYWKSREELANTKIKMQRLIILVAFMFVVFTAILSVFFYSRSKTRQKINEELTLANRELDRQKVDTQRLNADLREANATKDKFFSIVAHDLKNPFSSLLSLSAFLEEEYSNLSEKERKEFVKQIHDSSENTYVLLQNLLEWARTQTGKVSANPSEIDLGLILQETFTLLKHNFQNKQINLVNNIPLNTLVYADRNMVSAVFQNLISNAVKFTSPGGEIEVSSTDESSKYKISVKDNGVGISPENIRKLFRMDEKVHTKGTMNEKGTGLGLLLCKEFVERNNGNIWVESEAGKGSVFWFTLPKA